MPLDLTKYLALQPQIDADILLATEAVTAARLADAAASAAYNDAVDQLQHLRTVQALLQHVATITPTTAS